MDAAIARKSSGCCVIQERSGVGKDSMFALAAGRRTAAPAPTIGRAMAESWEADRDGRSFAGRAADGNRAAMFFDDLLD